MRTFWHPDEDSIIIENAGHIPFSEIVSLVQALDKANDWPIRSAIAVKKRFARLDGHISLRKTRPVKNLNTGEVYPTIRAAAKANFLSKNAIPNAISRDGSAAGCSWAYIND